MSKKTISHLAALGMVIFCAVPSTFSQETSKPVIFMDSSCPSSAPGTASSKLPAMTGDFGARWIGDFGNYSPAREIQIIDVQPLVGDFRDRVPSENSNDNFSAPGKIDGVLLHRSSEAHNRSPVQDSRKESDDPKVFAYPDYTKIDPVRKKVDKQSAR